MAAGTPPASPSAPRAAAAGPLWWMYVLIAASLAANGASVGRLLYPYLPATADGWIRAYAECTARYPTPNGTGTPGPARVVVDAAWENVSLWRACMAPEQRMWGVAMLVGAVALLAAAAVLTLFGPAVELRVLRRGVAGQAPTAARIRFAQLCEAHRLTGRRRPRLLMAPAGRREAFTTAAHGGRAYVVVPAGVAFRSGDPAVFDAIIHHELAHVAARDVAWVSAARWANRLTAPALGLACLVAVLVGTGVPDDTLAVAAQGLVLSGATALLVASLLRRREQSADRVAAAHLGGVAQLARAFDGGVFALRPRRRGLRVLRGFALHPSRASRSAALRNPPSLDGGFGPSAAVPVVGVLVCLQGTELLDRLLPGPSYNGHRVIAAGVGGLLIAACLVPLCLARARAARDAGRSVPYGPVAAGTAAGTTLGALLTPTGLSGPLAFFYLSPVVVALLATAGAATGTLCAGLAAQALSEPGSGPRRQRVRTGLAVAAATAAVGTALAMTMVTALTVVGHRVSAGLPGAGALTQAAQDSLADLAGLGFSYSFAGPALAFLFSLGLLVAVGLIDGTRTAARSTTRPWRWAGVVLAAALSAGTVAAVTAQWRLPLPRGLEMGHLTEQRWWACIAAGLVVAGTVLLRQRDPDPSVLVRAVTLGWSAAAVAAFLQYIRDAIGDGYWGAGQLNLHLAPVTWRFFLLTVLLAATWTPITQITRIRAARRAATARPGRTGPASTASGPRRVAPVRNTRGPLIAASTTLVLALAVVVTDAPWLYVMDNGDTARVNDALPPTHDPDESPATPRPAATGQDPSRALTQAETDRIVDAASASLSPSWGEATTPGDPVRAKPARCQSLLSGDAADRSLRPPRAVSQNIHPMRSQIIPVGPETHVAVTVQSFDRPIDATLLSTERDLHENCPRVTVILGSGRAILVKVRAQPLNEVPLPLTLGTGHEALTTTMTASVPFKGRSGDFEVRRTHVTIRTGHTLVTAWLEAHYIGEPPPAPLAPRALQRTLTTTLTAMLNTLATITNSGR